MEILITALIAWAIFTVFTVGPAYFHDTRKINVLKYAKNQITGNKMSMTAYHIEQYHLIQFVADEINTMSSYSDYEFISDVFNQKKLDYENKTRLEYIAYFIDMKDLKLSIEEVTDSEWMYLTERFNEMLKEKIQEKIDEKNNLESASHNVKHNVKEIGQRINYQAEALKQLRENEVIISSEVSDWDKEYSETMNGR